MKKILTAVFVSAIVLVACNPGTPDFLDPQDPPPPPPPPAGSDLAVKIVEIDKANDSAVATLGYTSAGEIEKLDVKIYASGVAAGSITGRFTYYSDKTIQGGWLRYVDPMGAYRADLSCPKNASGEIIGLRIIDSSSSGTDVTYIKFAFDNKKRLSKVYDDIDSTKFFSAAFPVNYRYVDSMVYDASDRLKEWYFQVFEWTPGSGVYGTDFKAFYSNFETGKTFIKTGFNSYVLFGHETVLAGIPKTIHEEGFHQAAPPTIQDITTTITYDASGRPTVMNIANSPSAVFNWNTGLFIPEIKQRKIFYQ